MHTVTPIRRQGVQDAERGQQHEAGSVIDDADTLVATARACGFPVGNILHGKLNADGKVKPGWRVWVAQFTAWWLGVVKPPTR